MFRVCIDILREKIKRKKMTLDLSVVSDLEGVSEEISHDDSIFSCKKKDSQNSQDINILGSGSGDSIKILHASEDKAKDSKLYITKVLPLNSCQNKKEYNFYSKKIYSEALPNIMDIRLNADRSLGYVTMMWYAGKSPSLENIQGIVRAINGYCDTFYPNRNFVKILFGSCLTLLKTMYRKPLKGDVSNICSWLDIAPSRYFLSFFLRAHVYLFWSAENKTTGVSVVQEIDAALSRVNRCKYRMGLVHGELHIGNVLEFNNDIKVVDWSSYFYGPVMLDLARLLHARIGWDELEKNVLPSVSKENNFSHADRVLLVCIMMSYWITRRPKNAMDNTMFEDLFKAKKWLRVQNMMNE